MSAPPPTPEPRPRTAGFEPALEAALQGIERRDRQALERLRARRRRARGLALGALLAVGALAVALLLSRDAGERPGPPAAPSGADAALLSRALAELGQGRFEAALATVEPLARERPTRPALLVSGQALLGLGRRHEAAPVLARARSLPAAPWPEGGLCEDWYVASHVAQALLGPDATGLEEQELIRLLETDLEGPGEDRARHRALLWSGLAVQRALARGDVPGGEEALRRAEAENGRHRRARAEAGLPEADVHYVLHARFAFAAIVRADAQAGREAARQARAAKEASVPALALPPRAAATARGDALEWTARAELLAARRGDPADLSAAESDLRAALALREQGGNPEGLASCRAHLALLGLLRGSPAQALVEADAALAAARASGGGDAQGSALLLRAQALLALERAGEARRAREELRALGEGPPDRTRALALAALELALDPGAASARSRLEQGRASPLADERRLAARTLEALAEGRPWALGGSDLLPPAP